MDKIAKPENCIADPEKSEIRASKIPVRDLNGKGGKIIIVMVEEW